MLSEDKQREQKEQDGKESSFNLRQLRSFSLVFWVLMAACFLTEISLGSFMDNLNDLLVKRFHIPYTNAGILLMIPFLGVAFFSVLVSLILKKKPQLRRTLYVASTSLYLVGQISLYFLPSIQQPSFLQYFIISFFCLTISFGYSIVFSGLQAAIPYVVNKETIGTAYGVLGCVVGLSQGTLPFVNIAIIDSDDDLAVSYRSLNLFYLFVASATVCLAVLMKNKVFKGLQTTFKELSQQRQEARKSVIDPETSSLS